MTAHNVLSDKAVADHGALIEQILDLLGRNVLAVGQKDYVLASAGDGDKVFIVK